MSWTCSLGWLRFTVPNATAEEAMSLVGGDWVADEKGFLGYSRSWICRGHDGGLGRVGSFPTPRRLPPHPRLPATLPPLWRARDSLAPRR